MLRDVRVTLGSEAKYRKSKNILFLTLYFNILDMVIKIKNLVYLVSFYFFDFSKSAMFDLLLDRISSANIIFLWLRQQNTSLDNCSFKNIYFLL